MTHYHLVTATKQAFMTLAFTFVIFSCDKQEVVPAQVGKTTINKPDKTSNTFKGGVPRDYKYKNSMLINIELK